MLREILLGIIMLIGCGYGWYLVGNIDRWAEKNEREQEEDASKSEADIA